MPISSSDSSSSFFSSSLAAAGASPPAAAPPAAAAAGAAPPDGIEASLPRPSLISCTGSRRQLLFFNTRACNVSPYLADVLALELADQLADALVVALNADGAEQSLDVGGGRGRVAADAEKKVCRKVLHFGGSCWRCFRGCQFSRRTDGSETKDEHFFGVKRHNRFNRELRRRLGRQDPENCSADEQKQRPVNFL